MKTKKCRTTKIYAINIERKKLLTQRREKPLQNTKDRKLVTNFLAAFKADHKANSASNDIQSSANMNDELIDGSNTDIIIGVENTDNTAIAAGNVDNDAIDVENIDNDATNVENTDNAPINADKTSNAATDSEKSDIAAMSDDNTDNATMSDDITDNATMSNYNTDNTAMSNNNTDDAISGDGNTENTTTGETSTVDITSLLLYGRKTTDSSKVKTSKRHIPIMVKPSEPLIGDPPPDEIATATASGDTFDPTDVHVCEFFIQGTPNPKDLEGVEEDQLLETQQTIQDKLKERDEERERNITMRIKQYKEKDNFINKALLESVAQITEMTKSDHPTAAARVKSADKMVMLPPVFDGSKPEVAKQHYERFNQYIKFQTKSGNIKDPIAEAIELFEHTLDKKALVWFQEHKDKFVDLTTLKMMFLQRYIPMGKNKKGSIAIMEHSYLRPSKY